MKNVPTYYAKTLIIARIAATIIPTPIDFNNLIIFIRGVHFPNIFPYYTQLVYKRMFVYESCSIPQRKAKSHK